MRIINCSISSMQYDISMKYLAIDIGASSGKLLKAWLEGGCIHTEIVHRFPNRLENISGHLCWDTGYLEAEIINGLRKAGDIDYVSIDTWAVDYILHIAMTGQRMLYVQYREKSSTDAQAYSSSVSIRYISFSARIRMFLKRLTAF